MSNPFDAPEATPVPPVELTRGEAEALDYLHATAAPKALLALSTGTLGLSIIVLSILGMLQSGFGVAGLLRCGGYLLIVLVGAASGYASLQAWRVHERRLDLLEDAYDAELLFWQLAGMVAILIYLFACAGGLVLLPEL